MAVSRFLSANSANFHVNGQDTEPEREGGLRGAHPGPSCEHLPRTHGTRGTGHARPLGGAHAFACLLGWVCDGQLDARYRVSEYMRLQPVSV